MTAKSFTRLSAVRFLRKKSASEWGLIMDEIDFVLVGKKLRELRSKNGFTQEKFAEDLSCTIAFISNLENNRVKLNLRVLLYYSRMCNVSIDTILNAGRSNLTKSAEEKELLDELQKYFSQFSLKEQKTLIEILKVWINNKDN